MQGITSLQKFAKKRRHDLSSCPDRRALRLSLRRSGPTRRTLDAQQNLLAILQLIHQLLVKLDLIRRNTHRSPRLCVPHRRSDDFAQMPPRQMVVLVNVGHEQAAGGEYHFRVVLKVELGFTNDQIRERGETNEWLTCKTSLLNRNTIMFCILRYLTTHSIPLVRSVS